MNTTLTPGYNEIREDQIALVLTGLEFNRLMMLLGSAAADPMLRENSLLTANAINRGNPRWTPFKVKEL